MAGLRPQEGSGSSAGMFHGNRHQTLAWEWADIPPAQQDHYTRDTLRRQARNPCHGRQAPAVPFPSVKAIGLLLVCAL